jgi:glutamate-1-semialdehyde 2,1-aminomutase
MSDRWRKSRELLGRARGSLAGGVSSPFRAKAPVPLYFEDGCGCRLRDTDGNEYIDYALAWGPLILGHRHPALVAAMTRAASRPHIYGAQHELEIEVAEGVQRIVPCAERVAFTSSGSEAVQLALRLARAFTGRTKILKFEGHYHGWMDSALVGYRATGLESRGQVPNALENVVVAEWNDLPSVAALLDRHEIAAVICEPVLCNSGCIMPEPGFLQALRDLTGRQRALLVFDEIITGFRIAPGGAQEYFGVTPDLATLGKALAGGLPLSAVVGRAEILEQMISGGVSFGGTFNGNPVSLAASAATLSTLTPELLAAANRRGERLRVGIKEILARRRIPAQITGFGTAFSLHFTQRDVLRTYRDALEDDTSMLRRFLETALGAGLWLLPDGRWYTSAVHEEGDIDRTLEIAELAFAAS